MKHFIRSFFIVLLSGFLTPANGQGTVKDYDGNGYKTVKIGTQVWMTENLKVTNYSNGESISKIKEPDQWALLTNGAYCDLNDSPAYTKAFGVIYNWYTVTDIRNVCPARWHVPSESEWTTLVAFLADESGKDAASDVTSGKIAQVLIKLNAIMFRVLPEGFRGYDGEFTGLGYGGGGWWSSTEVSAGTAFYHGVNYNTAGRQRMEGRKSFGYHIRCIRD